MLKELTFEGNNRCYDQAICLNFNITETDIQNLCSSLKEVALKNAPEFQKASIKDVTIKQLVS